MVEEDRRMATRFFDCHTHLFPAERVGDLMRWIHRAILDFKAPVDTTPEQAVAELRAAGALRWANLLFPVGPNEAAGLHAWGYELAQQFPDMVPFGGVHIDDPDPLRVVQDAIEHYEMAGLKFHPMVQGFYPWDPHLARVLTYLDDRELPIYVHTGFDKWYGSDYDRAGLETMLIHYPEMPVVLSHIGFPDIEWVFSLADRFPQVWLDLTNVPGSFERMGRPAPLLEQLRTGLHRHRDRLLMGTDYPEGIGTLGETLAQYHMLGLDDGLLEDMLLISPERFFERFARQAS